MVDKPFRLGSPPPGFQWPHGRLRTVDCAWSIAHGRLRMVDCAWSIAHVQSRGRSWAGGGFWAKEWVLTRQAGSLSQCACEGVELAGWKSLSVLDVSTVTERNCVAARRGGEHREVNDQSVTSVNSIRPSVVASLLENAKPKTPVDPRRESRSHDRGRGRPQTKRNHIKSGDDRGGWRRNDRKIQRNKQGDLPEQVAASREKVARGRRGHTPTGLAPIR